MKSFFKAPVEIRQIFKTTILRNGKNRGVGGQEQSGRHREPVMIEIVDKRRPHRVFEKFHEMGIAEIHFRRGL